MILYKHLKREGFAKSSDFENLKIRGENIMRLLVKYKFPHTVPIKIYEEIYNQIFQTPNYHFRKYDMIGKHADWSAWTFVSYKKIPLEWSVRSQKQDRDFQNHWDSLFTIWNWMFIDFLDILHPFENKNFLFMSILLDFFLIKQNFLPIAIKTHITKRSYSWLQNTHNWYEIFLQSMIKIYEHYNYSA